MTVERIGGTSAELPESHKQVRTEPQAPGRTDQLELSGGAREAANEATYTRSDVAPPEATASRPAEVPMAQDARAQKLAEIRQRMEAGVYNSREIIEQIVDRLLDEWNVTGAKGTQSSAP